MSNEKTWRKQTWADTGYKAERFFAPGAPAAAAPAAGGDKMVDTLIQQTDDNLQAMAQKFRVETKSFIKPYVVRDHSWSTDQHDEMDAKSYQDDAPEGYDRSDYAPMPYNRPRDNNRRGNTKA